MDEENRCHIQRVEPPPWIGPPTSEKLKQVEKERHDELRSAMLAGAIVFGSLFVAIVLFMFLGGG
jgi:hypothetical protein